MPFIAEEFGLDKKAAKQPKNISMDILNRFLQVLGNGKEKRQKDTPRLSSLLLLAVRIGFSVEYTGPLRPVVQLHGLQARSSGP